MAEKLDAKETVSFEELLMSNIYTQEAKVVITKAELLEEIKTLQNKKN